MQLKFEDLNYTEMKVSGYNTCCVEWVNNRRRKFLPKGYYFPVTGIARAWLEPLTRKYGLRQVFEMILAELGQKFSEVVPDELAHVLQQEDSFHSWFAARTRTEKFRKDAAKGEHRKTARMESQKAVADKERSEVYPQLSDKLLSARDGDGVVDARHQQ